MKSSGVVKMCMTARLRATAAAATVAVGALNFCQDAMSGGKCLIESRVAGGTAVDDAGLQQQQHCLLTASSDSQQSASSWRSRCTSGATLSPSSWREALPDAKGTTTPSQGTTSCNSNSNSRIDTTYSIKSNVWSDVNYDFNLSSDNLAMHFIRRLRRYPVVEEPSGTTQPPNPLNTYGHLAEYLWTRKCEEGDLKKLQELKMAVNEKTLAPVFKLLLPEFHDATLSVLQCGQFGTIGVHFGYDPCSNNAAPSEPRSFRDDAALIARLHNFVFRLTLILGILGGAHGYKGYFLGDKALNITAFSKKCRQADRNLVGFRFDYYMSTASLGTFTQVLERIGYNNPSWRLRERCCCKGKESKETNFLESINDLREIVAKCSNVS